MTSRGIYNGLGSEQIWRLFTPPNPILVASDATGSATQPNIADSTVIARYRYDAQIGRVTYQGYINFSSNATFGSAAFGYNVLLPYPCARDLGGADLLVGSGYLSQGATGKFMPLRIVQSDPEIPLGTTANTSYDEDHYIQFFVESNSVAGTATIASGSTTATITHGLGIAPTLESDIAIVPTNNAATTQNPAYWWITNMTSTQFTVNIKQTATTAGFSFSWKVSDESLLVTDRRPFGAFQSGWTLAWNTEYQARR